MLGSPRWVALPGPRRLMPPRRWEKRELLSEEVASWHASWPDTYLFFALLFDLCIAILRCFSRTFLIAGCHRGY